MGEEINKRVINATKWSTITEILAKLVVPITNLILARILAPETFGIVATVTMVTSFADMLTDAGFQKYIIQHEFKNKKELYEASNVAFLTNFIMSLLSWFVIVLFRNKIACFLGNDGLGFALMIASLQLPITALSSIQMALYKREFDFKTLFYRRIISVLLPFAVTIPLALLGFDYWSLIIGTLTGTIVNAIILTWKSKWKPNLFYKFTVLKEMFSFSIWTLISSVVIWLSSYIDIFILGTIFNNYYLGIYNNSIHIVNAIMNIITSSITPVLLSGLSRYQNNNIEYSKLLLKVQKTMAYFIIPMGVGIFLYQELVTHILLGDGWQEAAKVIGIASLVEPIKILLSNCISICYVSKGKPKLSIITELLYIIPLVFIGIYMANKGFYEYVYTRQIFKFELIIINLIVVNKVINVSSVSMIKNLLKPMFATIIMFLVAVFLKCISNNIIWSFISIFMCIIVYFIVLYIIDKNEIKLLKEKILDKNVRRN